MKTNIFAPGITTFKALPTTGFAMNGHTGNWVDTDLGAAVPHSARAILVQATPTKAGGDFVGIREPGSVVNPSQGVGAGVFVTFVSGVVESHAELKDDTGAVAEANNYYVNGYFL